MDGAIMKNITTKTIENTKKLVSKTPKTIVEKPITKMVSPLEIPIIEQKNVTTVKMLSLQFNMDGRKIRRIIRKHFGLNKKLWEFENGSEQLQSIRAILENENKKFILDIPNNGGVK